MPPPTATSQFRRRRRSARENFLPSESFEARPTSGKREGAPGAPRIDRSHPPPRPASPSGDTSIWQNIIPSSHLDSAFLFILLYFCELVHVVAAPLYFGSENGWLCNERKQGQQAGLGRRLRRVGEEYPIAISCRRRARDGGGGAREGGKERSSAHARRSRRRRAHRPALTHPATTCAPGQGDLALRNSEHRHSPSRKIHHSHEAFYCTCSPS
ncbi:hypothetical protein EVAR_98078_1 [Eumeta japonica]|uniref:Uncharacterized protein n=1 Tax=Eumeta variegata TaxID=151549 RepID=A0A4C1WFE0_EUMVA|nr:hypothetical protein EVAR_98078_1 [Eumeta japonica]